MQPRQHDGHASGFEKVVAEQYEVAVATGSLEGAAALDGGAQRSEGGAERFGHGLGARSQRGEGTAWSEEFVGEEFAQASEALTGRRLSDAEAFGGAAHVPFAQEDFEREKKIEIFRKGALH